MVEAWFMDDNSDVDQRESHRQTPNVAATAEQLSALGILANHFASEPYNREGCGVEIPEGTPLHDLCKERKYVNHDVVTCSRDKLPDYDAKLKMFYTEHIHEDEEIRFVLEGSGYFDVRDKQDRWIRVAVAQGDLLILPAGIYHRFTLDTNNYIKALRLFQTDPKWTPINRPCDENSFRAEWVDKYGVAA